MMNKKIHILVLCASLGVFSAVGLVASSFSADSASQGVVATAVTPDTRVLEMGNAFVAALPTNWTSQVGVWKYFDSTACYASGKFCYGNNPSSPYGFPSFTIGTGSAIDIDTFKVGANDAIVLFLRTPPSMRYFGFTQYLMNREGVPDLIFGSLSDTLNLKKMNTFGSTTGGVNVFNQYAVIVWTPDMNTLVMAKSMLHAGGIPDSAINFIPLPIQLPLYLGTSSTSDTFSMLMRTALPDKQEDLDAYIAQAPFYVVRIRPKSPTANSPVLTTGYASEISGVTEGSTTQVMLNNLVSDIKKNYLRTHTMKSQNVTYGKQTGWDCIAQPALHSCNGDNHDALYSVDVPGKVILGTTSGMVIVAGVNHRLTGKALYLNHAIYNPENGAGVAAITDTLFVPKSALYHAGIKRLSDPRVKQYQNLYAYAISYNCAGMSYCFQIPAPTPTNPVGLLPGTPFWLLGRSYVDPITTVRPSTDEVVSHQVLIGTRK